MVSNGPLKKSICCHFDHQSLELSMERRAVKKRGLNNDVLSIKISHSIAAFVHFSLIKQLSEFLLWNTSHFIEKNNRICYVFSVICLEASSIIMLAPRTNLISRKQRIWKVLGGSKRWWTLGSSVTLNLFSVYTKKIGILHLNCIYRL